MPARTIAIGDIHGCSLALDALLDVVAPRSADLVITLGDYVNRGPDSRGVLDRLIDLAGRCRLVPILGNHDECLLQARLGRHFLTWIGMGGTATLHSYGPGRDLGSMPETHVRFLEGCLDFFETDRHIFTHASYDPALPMSAQEPTTLRWESLRDRVPGPHVSGKRVVVGHTSQKSGEVLDFGHVTCIDTNCQGGGWLTAFEVESGDVWQTNQRGEVRGR